MTDQENNYYFTKLREDLYAHYKEWEEPIALEEINSKNIKEKGLGVLTTDLKKIEEKFNNAISLGTLKGFYGVDKNYKSFPNGHTLNIISIYLDYQDWDDYITKNKKEEDKKAKIYFSYAWRDEHSETGKNREDLVEKLYQSLKTDGFDVIRDKENCKYGESISSFIKEIGKSDLIIVFVSEKYAKSPYCMQELFLIAQNNKFDKSSFQNTILPIVVEFIKFDEPKVLREYFEHWKNKEHEWQQFINDFPNHTRAQSERLHIAKDIQNQFGLLSDWIADINASNNKLLEENDFEIVKKVITQRMEKQQNNMKEEKSNCPKTYEEFKLYLAKNELSDVFDKVDECFVEMQHKHSYNAMKGEHESDKYGILTKGIKDRLKTLIKDQFQ